MEPKYRAPRGMSDMVFPDSERVDRIVRIGCEILVLHGYRKIETPILESTELFARSIGEETDIVTKEMYTFEDRGGESLTLRPEATAPVVRAYLEKGLLSRGLPQKLYYFGPMFRRERPQSGRFREFHQIGAEAIGSGDPYLDAEIISISYTYFRRLGLEQFRLLVNSVGCRECRPAYRGTLTEYLEGVRDQLCQICKKRIKTNPLRTFDCKEPTCMRVLSKAPSISDYYCRECREHFDLVLNGCDHFGVPYTIDRRLVRGLDYYTRTAFEFQFQRLGSQNTVSAGGRYDDLAEQLGGPPTPGVGFSLGVERLMMGLAEEGLEPPSPGRLDVYVARSQGVDMKRLYELLGGLRGAGISADTDFLKRSLKKQLKQADRLKARLVLIVGEDELKRGEVAVRDLDESRQWNLALDSVVTELTEYFKGE